MAGRLGRRGKKPAETQPPAPAGHAVRTVPQAAARALAAGCWAHGCALLAQHWAICGSGRRAAEPPSRMQMSAGRVIRAEPGLRAAPDQDARPGGSESSASRRHHLALAWGTPLGALPGGRARGPWEGALRPDPLSWNPGMHLA